MSEPADDEELDESWGKPCDELEYDENEQPVTVVIDTSRVVLALFAVLFRLQIAVGSGEGG